MTVEAPARPADTVTRTRTRRVASYAPLLVLVVLLVLPWSTLQVPGLFSGALNSPGTLQLLALCLLFGGVALSYDLLFGVTGLLSFGHALYFAAGTYVANVALTKLGWGLPAALTLTAAVAVLLPLVLGAVCLRVSGLAFAMVTLAFAQVGSILVLRDPGGLTGGEEGLSLDQTHVPGLFTGVVNTVNLYWLALAFLVVVYLVAWWLTGSNPGRVLLAIRENERRVQVLGLRPYSFKLLVFVVASVLASAGGVVYLLLIGGSTPESTTSSFTLSLLVMVVLGGTGSRWGAIVGGVVYTYLDNRLGALASSDTVAGLPGWLQAPLSEPLFVLGTVFVLIVFFAPGGVAGLAGRVASRRRAVRLEDPDARRTLRRAAGK